jgi:hypothetical protein
MRSLFLFAILVFSSSSFATNITVTPNNAADCSVRNYSKVGWIKNVELVENATTLSVSFDHYVGSCYNNIRESHMTRSRPSVQTWVSGVFYFPWTKNIIDLSVESNGTMAHLNITVDKDDLFKNKSQRKIDLTLIASTSRKHQFDWTLDLTKVSDDVTKINFKRK